MIDLTMNEKQLHKTIQRCKERDIIIPTFQQMKHPQLIPDSIKTELKSIGLWDIHPRNLFRISWKNEPVHSGGGFNGVNYMVLPPELTGVKAKIIALVGKWFPTGAHKVGATFGCLVPRLITGQFDPTSQKRSGHPREIIVAVVPMIQRCWPANPSQFYPRKCLKNALNGFPMWPVKSLLRQVAKAM